MYEHNYSHYYVFKFICLKMYRSLEKPVPRQVEVSCECLELSERPIVRLRYVCTSIDLVFLSRSLHDHLASN